MAHSHSHHHAAQASGHSPQDFSKAFAIAILLNLAFTVIEAIYALMANSSSLLADAAHNLGDVLGLAIAWFASWLMGLEATEKFTYGYKRTTILAAFTNAVLLVVASVLIVVEAIDKLFHPAPVHELTVIVVAMIGIVINGGSALLFMKGRHDDLNLQGAYLHLLLDGLLSIGVVVVGVAVWFTNWLWLDPVMGIVIVLIILFSTWRLLTDSLNLMMDAVPTWVSPTKVQAYLEEVDDVCAVHHMHIWGLSTQGAALTAHIVTKNGVLSNEQYATIKQDLKAAFKIEHVTLQVELASDEQRCSQIDACH